MRRRTERRAGFALIEVLAALVVTAALVAIALPYAANLLQRWGTGQSDMESADAWMQAIERLTDDVAEAVPISLLDHGQRIVAFQADSRTIKFVRPAIGDAARTGLETVSYSILSRPEGDALVRHSGPFKASFFPDERASSAETILLDGPFRLRFTLVEAGRNASDGSGALRSMPEAVALWIQGLARAQVPPGPVLLPVVARGKKPESAPPVPEKEL